MTILINPPGQAAENIRPGPDKAAARDRIAADLASVGVRRSGVLLVHSSLSALGHVPGGAETVILGLLRALGPEGTLLFPTLSYEIVRSKNPIFDVRHTLSNVGLIPETFRKRPGTMRSIHPTHSVAGIGTRAKQILADHVQDTTPCGPHSPFHLLPQMQGQILMLGCGLRPNTSMHAIEEVVVPPYLFGPEMLYVLVYPDGSSVEKLYTTHGFRGWRQRYDRVGDLIQAPALCEGRVLQAEVHLIEAEALWEAVLSALRQDPHAFVARDSFYGTI